MVKDDVNVTTVGSVDIVDVCNVGHVWFRYPPILYSLYGQSASCVV